jgi:hypothetical protein
MKIRLNIINKGKLFIGLLISTLYFIPHDTWLLSNVEYIIKYLSNLIIVMFLNAFLVYIIIKLISESIEINILKK